ncbi:MAG: SMR family transporter [Saprospiraceae bacterium]|nr:SMR family transporter [Saprospiraceae bacterium]MDW8485188.1 SMR family transporter [Saprospiraceae bacterium]
MSPWTSLVIASAMEICWIYSLKWLDFKRIAAFGFPRLFLEWEGWLALMPLLGYVAFGLANIYFFSIAMKGISPSTAFAVWMGLALIGTKLVGIAFFREDWNWTQVLFIALILIGAVGLKSEEKGS